MHLAYILYPLSIHGINLFLRSLQVVITCIKFLHLEARKHRPCASLYPSFLRNSNDRRIRNDNIPYPIPLQNIYLQHDDIRVPRIQGS